jgi:hypothetical protein
MRTTFQWVLIFLPLLAGCSPRDAANSMPAVKETNVLAMLKAIETFQSVRLMEQGNFAHTLQELKVGNFSNKKLDELVTAQSASKPYSGYFFRDIVSDENGSPLDNQIRYGIAVIPENPGKETSFLLLIDTRNTKFENEGATSRGIGGETYKSQTATLAGDKWPSASELARWELIVRRTPEEALKAARQVKENFDGK